MHNDAFPTIEGVLSAIFSVQTGLSDEAAKAMLMRALSSGTWRSRLEAELIKAFSSRSTNWKALLNNDRYEVFEPKSDEEARSFIVKALWEPTFPQRPLP